MSAVKIVAIVLIVLGVLGLVYGGFSYTKDSHKTTVGPISLTIKDKEKVNIPIWAGVGAIAVGSLLLVFGKKQS